MPRWAIDITAGTGGFEAATKRIPASAKKAAQGATAAHKAAARDATSAWSGAQRMLAGVGVAAAAAWGVKTFVQDVIDMRNELADTSIRTAQTTETIEALRLAAEGTGQEFAPVAKALEKLPKLLADADAGLSTATRAFSNLGIATHDADGNIRSADEVFTDFRRAIDEIEDPTLRAARAADLFGAKAGGKMLQALQGGADHFEVLRREAEAFGVDAGPEAMEAAAGMQRDFARLGLVMRGVKADLVDAFGAGKGEGLDVLTDFGAGLRATSAGLSAWWKGEVPELGVTDLFDLDAWKEWGAAYASIHRSAMDAGTEFWQLTDEERRTADGASEALAALNTEIERNGKASGKASGRAKDPQKELQKDLATIAKVSAEATRDLKTETELLTAAYIEQTEPLLELIELRGMESEVGIEAMLALEAADKRLTRDKIKAEEERRAEEEAAELALRDKLDADAERRAAEAMALERRTTQGKLAIAYAASDSMIALSGLMVDAQGEATAEGKALAKAGAATQIISSTAAAIMSSWEAYADIPFVGPALALVQSGLIAATGVAQLAQVATAYTGLDARSTGSLAVVHPGESVATRSETERTAMAAADPMVVPVMLDGRPLGRSWSRQVRRGGVEARTLRARSGRIGHRSY